MIVTGILALVSLLAFLHPYVTYPLSLTMLKSRPIHPAAADIKFSLLFSAFNEEKSLPEKLANLRAIKAAHPEVEILAYCDLSTDRTLDMLREASDTLQVVAATQRTGKATGMGRLARMASGDVCIFTDANVILDPASIDLLRKYFGDPTIGGVAGSLIYTNNDESATASAGGLYWRLEEVVKSMESRTGSIMGADGSIFAVRRSLYPEVPPHLLDDMIVSMSAPIGGQRLVFAPDVLAYEKNATSTADEFRRKRRIACRAFNTHKFLWPKICASFTPIEIYKYCSHKLMRWFGLVPLVTFAVSATALLAMLQMYYMIAALSGIAAVCLMLGVAGVRPFSVINQILVAVVATFMGIFDSASGKTYQTWTPAQSRN